MIATETDFRLCHYCHTYKPAGEFRRRTSGDDARRVNQCATCHAGAMRDYRASRKDKRLAQFTKRVSQTNDAKLLCTFVALAMRKFGGVERLAKDFVEHLNAAPPTQMFLGFTAWVNLLIANDTLNPPPDPSTLSDEDLKREMDALLCDFLKDTLDEDEADSP